MHDKLFNIRQLPTSLLKHLDKLIVNRIGNKPDAYMITRDIIGHVDPQTCYQLVSHDSSFMLRETDSKEFTIPACNKNASTPPTHALLTGHWINEESIFVDNANILGGMGMLHLDEHDDDKIPVIDANAQALAFYNAYLLSEGSIVQFESNTVLPLTDVSVGKDYVHHFLTQKEHGGGEYIEYHDQPHLWLPKSPQCSGHILLGKQEQDKYYFTGFRIPYGHAVYLSPYTLHADPYLIGDYVVVYTVTENYSTVLFQHKEKAHLEFTEVAC